VQLLLLPVKLLLLV
jgi:hypothetical protein